MSDDKDKPDLPPPNKAPKPKSGTVKEYGDGASPVTVESDK